MQNLKQYFLSVAILLVVFISLNYILGIEKISGVTNYKYSSISFPCTLCGHSDGSKANTLDICTKPCNPIYGFYSEYIFWGFVIFGLTLITLYFIRFKKLTKLSFFYNFIALLFSIYLFELIVVIFNINILSVTYWEGVNAHYYLTHSIFSMEIFGETQKTYLIAQAIIYFVLSLFIYLFYGIYELIKSLSKIHS